MYFELDLYISPTDPLQWMGAIRMRVQAAVKNITIIHKQSTPLQSKSFNEAKRSMFVNISIIKTFLTSNRWFQLRSSQFTIFSVKVISSKSGDKYAQIKHHLQVKTVQNSSKQTCGRILMQYNRGWTFLLEEALVLIVDSYFARSDFFLKLKHLG